MQGTLVGVLLLTIAAIALPWPASAETRIALVIGNSAYPSRPLSSPKDDAKAIEAKLKVLGFQITRVTDLRREEFFDAIRHFGDRLQQSGTIGLFYYSGHGMEVNNRNYMIPIDADIRSEVDVVRYAVPVEDVLARMKLGKSNLNIVILDACRSNPFEKRFKSSQEGLARMNPPEGTLIAFAAAPGSVSEAGFGGELSLYTAVLAKHIDQPYPDFIDMFRAVQNDVFERSGRKQSPHLDLSPGLPDFSFKLVVAAMPSPTPMPLPTPPSAQPAVNVNPAPTASLLKRPSQSENHTFDGWYYSPEFRYGFQISENQGTATISNSSTYKHGDVILRFTTSGQKLIGEQICTDGKFYPVTGTLSPDGALDMTIQGCSPRSWRMVRTENGYQPPPLNHTNELMK